MHNPADVAITFEQAEGGAFLCGGDICTVRVKTMRSKEREWLPKS
jgi:hypothetical protein